MLPGLRENRVFRFTYAATTAARILSGYKILSMRKKGMSPEEYDRRLRDHHRPATHLGLVESIPDPAHAGTTPISQLPIRRDALHRDEHLVGFSTGTPLLVRQFHFTLLRHTRNRSDRVCRLR